MPPRGLPGNIVPDNQLWCVSGDLSDNTGGGVIDWCYDRADAEQRLTELRKDKGFKNLTAHKWDQSEQNWQHKSWTKEGGCDWDDYRNYVENQVYRICREKDPDATWFPLGGHVSHEHTRSMYNANTRLITT